MNMNRATNLMKVNLLPAALLALAAGSANAIEFENGEWSGSFDTTVSYGAQWRAGDLDPENVGKAYSNPLDFLLSNAERRESVGRWSVNSDDGNRNYPDSGDLVSNTIKFNSEIDVRWRNFGGFTRFTGFYDFENAGKDFLSKEADKLIGKDLKLIDLYVWGEHEVGEHFLNWRLGRQVVSWGESTFIAGGINSINSADLSRLHVAGAELKDVYEGVNMLLGNIDLTPSLSLEALYMFEHRDVIPDPVGSFFSTDDIGTPGGSYVMLGFGAPDQPVINPDLYSTVCQQGKYAESDSPLPVELVAAGCGAAVGRIDGPSPSDSGQYGAALRWFVESLNSTEFGFYYLNYHSRLPVISGIAITTTAPSSGKYYTEYPEDIHLWGVSFNSNIGTWAWSGEVSYRPNAPLQMDDVELLFAALTPLNPLIPAPWQRFKSQMGEFAPGEGIKGWTENNSWQAQTTIFKVFGPNNFLKANQIVFISEIGFNYVSDLPSKDYQRYNGPGTDTGGGADYLTGDYRNPYTEPAGFADDFSWGYRIAARADYNNVFGPVTVSPRFAWAHDVNGTTPGPGGSFIEGRKTITIGLAFNYLEQWIFDFAYTNYSGAGHYNVLYDRDFYSASVSYSF
jgi:hypothetical protein